MRGSPRLPGVVATDGGDASAHGAREKPGASESEKALGRRKRSGSAPWPSAMAPFAYFRPYLGPWGPARQGRGRTPDRHHVDVPDGTVVMATSVSQLKAGSQHFVGYVEAPTPNIIMRLRPRKGPWPRHGPHTGLDCHPRLKGRFIPHGSACPVRPIWSRKSHTRVCRRSVSSSQ